MDKVGIEIELTNAETALKTLEKIDSAVRDLGRKKTMVKLDDGSLVSVDERIREIQDKLVALRSSGSKKIVDHGSVKNAKQLNGELRTLQRGIKNATAGTRTFKQEFNSISSSVGHIGSAMQSLGNSLVRLTSPFRRITTGLFMGVGYKTLNLFTEGLGGAFERYDVMKNYSRTLEAFGFSAKQAQDSIDKLNDAVLGLPTGLDEIVAAQKVYVGATNDLAKSTDIAIAANNTFLASGMGSREQRFMQKYLVALGSGAELAASQWDSMARIAPMAMQTVSRELGYADKDYQQFISDVKKGKVATDEFLDAFIKVGSEGAISDAANVMKMSFTGLSANIQNAAKRMGEGILKSLDEVFMSYNDRTLLQTLLGVDANGEDMGDGIKHWIDNLSASIQNWVKSHPEEITEFFETLRSIDWAGLVKGFGKGAMDVLGLLKRFADWISGADMSKIGRAMVWANMIGNALLVIGGVLKGTRHIWGAIGALIKIGGKGGVLGGLLGGLFGSGGGAGGSMLGAGIGSGTFVGIGKIGLVAAEITGIIGALSAIVSAFAAIDMKLWSSAFKSFNEITQNLNAGMENLSNVKETDVDMNAVKGIIKKVADVYTALQGIPMSAGVTKRMATNTENIRNAVWQLRRVAYQINQASGANVDVGGFKAFVEQIKEAVESLHNLDQTMELDIKVVLGSGFKSSANGVEKQIKDTRKKIQSAVDYVANHTYRATVTVNISARVNTAGAINSIQSGIDAVRRSVPTPTTQAMGGVVYRAKGGSIFRRRGTDTVPAMLTPGEFVQNRKAVSTFGIDFMRKVNSLDMKGAMSALMHKAGSMANVNRGTTVTNNYNNNQRVTINNNGSPGTGFTFKIASRFVGAF